MDQKLNLYSHSAALSDAKNELFSPNSSTTWVLFGYAPGSSVDLIVKEKGSGGLRNLVQEFEESKLAYALAKVVDENSGLAKIVAISWCPDGVPYSAKKYFQAHLADVLSFFKGYHVEIKARNEDDIQPEYIMKRVKDSSGAKYSIQQPQLQPQSQQQQSQISNVPTTNSKLNSFNTSTFIKGPSSIIKGPSSTTVDAKNNQSADHVKRVMTSSTTINEESSLITSIIPPSVARANEAAELLKKTKISTDEWDDKPSSPMEARRKFESYRNVNVTAESPLKSPLSITRANEAAELVRSSKNSYKTDESNIVGSVSTSSSDRAKEAAELVKRSRETSQAKPQQTFNLISSQQQNNSSFVRANEAAQIVKMAKSNSQDHYSSSPPKFPSRAVPPPPPPNLNGSQDIERKKHEEKKLEEQRRIEDIRREEAWRLEEQKREEERRIEDRRREEERQRRVAIEEERRIEEQKREEQRRLEEQKRKEERRLEEQKREEEKRLEEEKLRKATFEENNVTKVGKQSTVNEIGQYQSYLNVFGTLKGTIVVVEYDHVAQDDNELTIKIGDRLVEVEKIDEDWWFGVNEKTKISGLFPASYVAIVENNNNQAPVINTQPLQSNAMKCIALYDYAAGEDNEISFRQGDIITNVDCITEDWWQGFGPDKRYGLFPSNYVQRS